MPIAYRSTDPRVISAWNHYFATVEGLPLRLMEATVDLSPDGRLRRIIPIRYTDDGRIYAAGLDPSGVDDLAYPPEGWKVARHITANGVRQYLRPDESTASGRVARETLLGLSLAPLELPGMPTEARVAEKVGEVTSEWPRIMMENDVVWVAWARGVPEGVDLDLWTSCSIDVAPACLRPESEAE